MKPQPNAERAGETRPGPRRAEEAYRRILALITEGGLSDGDRLPSETDMAARFGVSRPLIRQALSRLQAAGVVDVRWGAGSYVRDASGAERNGAESGPSFGPVRSLDEVRYVFELRKAIEGDAAAFAAERRSAPAIAAIRRQLDRLQDAVTTGAVGQDADLAFHFAIAAASQNPFFERMLRSIQRPLEFMIGLARTLSLTHPEDRLRIVQGEHEAVVRAIEAGDPDAARKAMRLHLENSCRRLFQGPGDTYSGGG